MLVRSFIASATIDVCVCIYIHCGGVFAMLLGRDHSLYLFTLVKLMLLIVSLKNGNEKQT